LTARVLNSSLVERETVHELACSHPLFHPFPPRSPPLTLPNLFLIPTLGAVFRAPQYPQLEGSAEPAGGCNCKPINNSAALPPLRQGRKRNLVNVPQNHQTRHCVLFPCLPPFPLPIPSCSLPFPILSPAARGSGKRCKTPSGVRGRSPER